MPALAYLLPVQQAHLTSLKGTGHMRVPRSRCHRHVACGGGWKGVHQSVGQLSSIGGDTGGGSAAAGAGAGVEDVVDSRRPVNGGHLGRELKGIKQDSAAELAVAPSNAALLRHRQFRCASVVTAAATSPAIPPDGGPRASAYMRSGGDVGGGGGGGGGGSDACGGRPGELDFLVDDYSHQCPVSEGCTRQMYYIG
jgi:hypothetical protein